MTTRHDIVAVALLTLMLVLAGGAALRQSVTIDEVTHLASGVTYLQKLEMRLNSEHPPLPKLLAAIPPVLRGTNADYSNAAWLLSEQFFSSYMAQWHWGEMLLTRWNDPRSTLILGRIPMLLLTLALGWFIYVYATKLGGKWGGLLSLSIYASSPLFIAVGPLVLTDVPVALFTLVALYAMGELWNDPSGRNMILLAVGMSGALLSKFSALILFLVFAMFIVTLGYRPPKSASLDITGQRVWRRIRWRAFLKSMLWTAAAVYILYLVFSWNQSTVAVERLPAFEPLRRLAMPVWLYIRGVAMMLLTASRPTFILGESYPRGVWFYFPVLFIFKSTIASIALWGLATVMGFLGRRWHKTTSTPAVALHWAVLTGGLIIFTAMCLLSPLNIGYRHFAVPAVLLMVMLAPLPNLIERIPSPRVVPILRGVLVLLAVSSILSAIAAYPNYIPYTNAFARGRPAYMLMNDSNVDWNHALPEARAYMQSHGFKTAHLDFYGLSDSKPYFPEAKDWNCQDPAPTDGGSLAIISANMILEARNCNWLMQYSPEPLAGGSMYAIRLPDMIPPPGAPGGPPLPADRKLLFGLPIDLRAALVEASQHPERLEKILNEIDAALQPPAENAKK